MDNWKQWPLGFAVADETKNKTLALHHVSISVEGVAATGLWEVDLADKELIRTLVTHRIPIGTADGVAVLKKTLGRSTKSADLARFVAACEQAEDDLQASWMEYRDLEPKKRANLVPLAARTWPAVAEDGDAAKILKKVGRQPYSATTPPSMKDIIAMARLVMYVAETWMELESERLSRAYLVGDNPERNLYPPQWLKDHRVYWPKAA